MSYVPNLSATYLIVCLLFWERNLLSCWLTQPGVIHVIHLPQLPRVPRLQAWTTAPSVFISCSSFTIFLLLSFKRICVFWVRSSLTVDLQIFLMVCHLIPLTMSFSETKKMAMSDVLSFPFSGTIYFCFVSKISPHSCPWAHELLLCSQRLTALISWEMGISKPFLQHWWLLLLTASSHMEESPSRPWFF